MAQGKIPIFAGLRAARCRFGYKSGSDMSVSLDARIGSEIAGYRIERVLGRGGMGVVYLAEDLRLKRRVALKLIAPELAEDARFRERFLRESELAASLDHSHVVPVHTAGETDGQLWIAMRCVEGTNLAALLHEDGPFEPGRALGLVSQVGSALDAAHTRGLVHRDVKPANVLVTREDGEEHCYLTDFGLARGAGAQSEPAASSHLSGTIQYSAPEQIRGEPTDTRADVYALGCVLFECLAGGPPFAGPRPIATLFAHLEEPPPSLHERRPELPEGIDAVFARALAKRPEERYETCGSFVEAARAVLEPARGPWTRAFHGLPFLLALAGLLVLGVALAAVLLTRGGQEAATPESLLPLTGDSLVRIDPQTGQVAAAIPAEGARWVGVTDGSVWFADRAAKRLTQVDPATSGTIGTFDISRVPYPDVFEAGEGTIWITARNVLDAEALGGGGNELWRLEASTGPAAATPALVTDALGPYGPVDIAAGPGVVWVVNELLEPPWGEILRIDARSGEIVARIESGVGLLAVAERSVWFLDGLSLRRIDPATGRFTASVPADVALLSLFPQEQRSLVLAGEGGMVAGEGAIWLLSKRDESVSRVDPSSGQVTDTVGVGRIPTVIAVGEGAVWVANARDGTVTRIDPRTMDVKTIDVGGSPTALAAGEGAVWVAVDT